MLLARHEPCLPLVALELAGRLAVVRAGRLAFDDAEAEQLVRAHAPRGHPDEVAHLCRRAQGWAAVLVLGARELASYPDPDGPGGPGGAPGPRPALHPTDPPVLSHLLGELLDRLPDPTRRVLVAVCDEPVVTAELAVALSEVPDAPQRLARLAGEGLLVTTAGDDAWRLHPVLQEAVRQRGQPDGDRRAAHVRGARYAHAVHDPAGTLRHAVLSTDEDLLAEALVAEGADLLAAGRAPVVLEAMGHLGPVVRAGRPALVALEALCHRQAGDVGAALHLVDRLEEPSGPPDPPEPAPGDPDAERLQLALWRGRCAGGDLAGAVAATDALLRSPAAASLSSTATCATLLELAAAEGWSGDLARASERARAAGVVARTLGTPRLVAGALALAASFDAVTGALQSARADSTAALDLAEQEGAADEAAVARARLALTWARLESLEAIGPAAPRGRAGSDRARGARRGRARHAPASRAADRGRAAARRGPAAGRTTRRGPAGAAPRPGPREPGPRPAGLRDRRRPWGAPRGRGAARPRPRRRGGPRRRGPRRRPGPGAGGARPTPGPGGRPGHAHRARGHPGGPDVPHR
ncbi:hypothetical protein [Nocardioides sp. TF02-7]|uniref:hypothetical protein n=1 Tax=Nocardioides sp. TF02-7 TaxID=2917724 RepID=UPI001F05AB46|nr:hypothetical protein [Nocardioides sp. TF02-7]UMG91513.1 hypothetical protein MF408_15500 [Nocardioides sp. TF02-7]